LKRKQHDGKKTIDQPPKPVKNRAKEPAEGQVGGNGTDDEPAAAAGADVRFADPKSQNQPGIKAAGAKKQVGKGGQPGTQRSQKAVVKAGQASKSQGNEKMLQRFMGAHPPDRPQNRRFSLGSS
jgi:hypothetical protein